MMSQLAKRVLKMSKIGTHSGTFHADEALAVYMLKALPKFRDAEVIRSRNQELLETCDIIVDVGGKYDGKKFFDHHQRGFEETFSPEYKTKLSSAGLIFKHFGKEIISHYLELPPADANVDLLYEKLYKNFMEAIDANDNGIPQYPESEKPAFKNYQITLPAMVAGLNPRWNEPDGDDAFDAGFAKASALIGEYFFRQVDYLGKAWLPGKKIVEEAINESLASDEKQLLVFKQYCPWKEHLHDLEVERGIEGQFIYVVYPDSSGKYRVQAVSKQSSGFENRKSLPEPWRGVRDEALSELSGIPGCVFVHAAGFIGGNNTEEGAIQMAKDALHKF